MRKSFVGLVTLISLAIAGQAQAATWSCVYDGSWSTLNSSDKGTFKWNMVWESKAGGGWAITGDYKDQYGNSILDGSCSDTACNLTQVYQSGELKGKKYYWKGTYTDEARSSSRTVNRFEGSWGSTPSASEGPWRAIATCMRN
jgi:hypothetical protein